MPETEFYVEEQHPRGEAGRWIPKGGIGHPTTVEPVDHLAEFEAAVTGKQSGPRDAYLAKVKGWYEGPLPGGYSSTVLRVRVGPGTAVTATGKILDPDNQAVGTFNRVVFVGPDGTLHVQHKLLKIDPEHRGQGLGSAFNAQAEKAYAANGITRITLVAADDVGGYAWARAGYDWDTSSYAKFDEAKGRILNVIDGVKTRSIEKGVELTPAVQAQHELLRRRVIAANHHDALPTPFEVSQLGYTPGATMWPGKAGLLGQWWLGQKAVKPAAGTGTAAFYVEAQHPRGHGGRWVTAGGDPGAEFDAAIAGDNPEFLDHVKSWYEGDLPHGFTSEAKVHVADEGIAISGVILAPGGNRVGAFTRSIWHIGDHLVADHNELGIDPDYQGQGLGSAFNARAEQAYAHNGVTEVSLEANIDVGGYAWARAGYDWLPGDRLKSADKILRRIFDAIGDDDDVFAEAMAMSNRLNAAEAAIESGERDESEVVPTPFELSRIGYRPGAETWPGKAGMLGSSWSGRKAIPQASARPLVAAAGDTEHAPFVPPEGCDGGSITAALEQAEQGPSWVPSTFRDVGGQARRPKGDPQGGEWVKEGEGTGLPGLPDPATKLVRSAALTWTSGQTSDLRFAAALETGITTTDHRPQRGQAVDGMIDQAAAVIDAIAASPPIDVDRGLRLPFAAVDRLLATGHLADALATSTTNTKLAEKFADGAYGRDLRRTAGPGHGHVPVIVHYHDTPALPVTHFRLEANPNTGSLMATADEHLISGHFTLSNPRWEDRGYLYGDTLHVDAYPWQHGDPTGPIATDRPMNPAYDRNDAEPAGWVENGVRP